MLKQTRMMDEKQLNDLKSRVEKANEKEKQIIMAAIQREEEKKKINDAIRSLEEKLLKSIETFNQSIRSAIESLNEVQSYYVAKKNLANARLILADIFNLIEQMQNFEKKLSVLTKAQTGLLRKEKQVA